jgi:hypothetical protein
VRLTKTLVSPELASSAYCFVSWSPNGRYLALSEEHDGVRYYRVDLTASPAPDSASEGAPSVTLSTTHTPAAVQYLGVYERATKYGVVCLGDSSALVTNDGLQWLLARPKSEKPSAAVLDVPS